MATIGSLVVSIRATVDDFIGDMKSIQRELEETNKYIKPLKESLLQVGEAMSAVGDIVAAGMFEITKKTAEYGAELERLHQRTGIATDDLSAMAVAAKQAGVPFEDVSNAFKKFASAAENAAQGSKKQATAFADLGVAVTGVNGALRPTGDMFLDVADKIGGMADGTQKAAIMNDIFGKSGSLLIPLMDEIGTQGFDVLKAKAQALGLVFSDVAAKNSEEFHQALATVEQSMEGLGATIGQQLMPIFTDLMGHISSIVVAVKDWVAAHPDMTKAVLLLAAAIGGTGGLILAVAGAIAILPALTAAMTALMGPLGIAIAAVTAFTAAFMAFPSFRAVVLDVLKNITDAVAIVGSELASVGQAVINLAKGDLKGAYNTMANSWTDAMTRMQQADDGFHNVMNVVTSDVKGFGTATKESNDIVIDATAKVGELEKALKKAYEVAYKASNDTLNQMQKDGDLAISYWSKVYEQLLSAEIKAAAVAYKTSTDTINQMQKDGDQAIEYWSKVYEKTLSEEAKVAEERIKEIEKQNAANAEYIKKTNAEVGKAAGKVFDDMFLKGQNVFSSLANALKGGALSIGRSIFSDVVGYLGGPLKRAFDDFFTSLLESSGLKSFLSGLGNKLGGLLSGIGLGGGSPSVDVGPQVPGSSGMSGMLKGGLITAGIAAALAVGEALYKKFTELGRDKATFVQNYQDPFGNNLKDIVNQFNAARLTGQLTVSDATTTLNSVKTLIGNFEANVADWMKKGGDYATVATRAQATMDANFGPNFSTLLDSMQTNIDQRQGVIDDPIVASTDANTTATNNLTDAFTSYDPSACTCDAIGSTIDSITKTVTPLATLGPTFGTNPISGISTTDYNSAVGAMMGGSQNSYGANTTVSTVNAANRGTAFNTPTGTIYLNAQQLSDLQNSGGSYTVNSGYSSIIAGAVAGTDLGTSVFYSPGSVANMSDDQRRAAGIPGYASGTPYVPRTGLAMLHQGERVVPASQNRGGGGNLTVNIYAWDTDGVERSIPKLVNALENNGSGEKDRLKRVLGVS
jgi:TP901 family phage tail tape measure protein